MSIAFDIRELPARLEESLTILTSGGEVILTEGGVPRARLVPYGGARPRIPGLHAGAIQAAPDFDAPLPDDFWAGQQ
jgi:antitoxin (DNA-binding transcriptional repressor) of toxin-antitoxin stability system